MIIQNAEREDHEMDKRERERVERMAAWPKSLARGAKKYIYI